MSYRGGARNLPLLPSAELQVHVLDVGPVDGDSILIISPSGQTVLIDAGDVGKERSCSTL
jgi:hypothetical protein